MKSLKNEKQDLFAIIDSNGAVKLRGETTQYEFILANMTEGDTYVWGCDEAFQHNKDWFAPDPQPTYTDEEIEDAMIKRTAERLGKTEEEVRNALEIRKLREQEN